MSGQLLSWSRGSDDTVPELVAKVKVVRIVVRALALEQDCTVLATHLAAAARGGHLDFAVLAGRIVVSSSYESWRVALRAHPDHDSLRAWMKQAAFAVARRRLVVDPAHIPAPPPVGVLVIDDDVPPIPAWVVGLATDVARSGGLRIMCSAAAAGAPLGVWWAMSRTIKLAADLDDLERVRALAHEIGHAVDPDPTRSTTESERWADRFAIVAAEHEPRTVADALRLMTPPADAVATLAPITAAAEARDRWLWGIAFDNFNLLTGEENND